MTEANSNHCQIVRESLTGKRAVDEQTFASLTILTERLGRLRKSDKAFAGVTLSSAAKKLAKQKLAVAV